MEHGKAMSSLWDLGDSLLNGLTIPWAWDSSPDTFTLPCEALVIADFPYTFSTKVHGEKVIRKPSIVANTTL
jgi:hypothetical protein